MYKIEMISKRIWRNIIVTFAFILLGLLIFVSIGVLYGPIKGAYYRVFRRPNVLNDSSIEVYSDSSGLSQRIHFLSIYHTGKESYGITRKWLSIEGTPIVWTVYVRKGVPILIMDYTRDSYGSRSYIIESLKHIVLDTIEEKQVQLNDTLLPKKKHIILRCYMSTDRVTIF